MSTIKKYLLTNVGNRYSSTSCSAGKKEVDLLTTKQNNVYKKTQSIYKIHLVISKLSTFSKTIMYHYYKKMYVKRIGSLLLNNHFSSE